MGGLPNQPAVRDESAVDPPDDLRGGFFASVSLKCGDNFDEDGNVKDQIMIPYRGGGNYVDFGGLEPIGELDDKK